MGLVAHPSRISDVSVTFDGKFVFTAGGADLSVNMWAVNVDPLINVKENPSMEPFYRLLDEGNNAAGGGELYDNIVDYFYYCQIRSHGENVMEARAITGKIPIAEISTLMRAIGFFPSEEEILNMANEIRYRYFMTTGVMNYDISLDEFIKLYINHRPLFPLNSNAIEDAFGEIIKHIKSTKDRKRGSRPNTAGEAESSLVAMQNGGFLDTGTIAWQELTQLLGIEGEGLSPNDLMSCLIALMGEDNAMMLINGAKDGNVAVNMNSDIFAEEILGFETSDA